MAQPWHMPLDAVPTIKKKNDAVYQPSLLKHFCNIGFYEQPKNDIQTGIMCDIGVLNQEHNTIHQLISAGMTVARLVLSNMKPPACTSLVKSVRQAVYDYSKEMNQVYSLALLIDLRGPDILTGDLKSGAVEIVTNTVIRLTTDPAWQECGNGECLYIGYDHLTSLRHGDLIYIDSLTGVKVKLIVSEIGNDSIECNVIVGGLIGSNMIVRIVQGATQVPTNKNPSQSDSESSVAITDDEFEHSQHIKWAIESHIDGFIISNIKTVRGIVEIRKTMQKNDGDLLLFVSVDSIVALENFDSLLLASDGIYLDRAQLGSCIPVENIFLISKMVVSKCNDVGKPCIMTATLNEELPYLCVTDLANLVYDGVDVIAMNFHYDTIQPKLTNHLNTLKIVEKCLAALAVTCKLAETTMWRPQIYGKIKFMSHSYTDTTMYVCISAVELAMRSQAAAIICVSNSGTAAKYLSYAKTSFPIIVVTRVCRTARILRFWRGVRVVHYFEDFKSKYSEEMDARVLAGVEYSKYKRILGAGDPYVVVMWSRPGVGQCNVVRLFYASARNTISQAFAE